MSNYRLMHALIFISAFILTGCVVRTYPVTKDRIDQDLSVGNRGYIKGSAPLSERKAKKTTRTTQVLEIELHSPIKFEKAPKQPLEKTPVTRTEDQSAWGNRGYLTQSVSPEIVEPLTGRAMVGTEKYTVHKQDTLQKISQKFYGTTKKWNKIYQANKDVLKSPNKIYPGQVIDIPLEPLKETKENLK